MKVIDLLNKLYNNEEVPKRIKIGVSYLTLNKNKDNYIYDNSDEYYGDELIHWYDLGMKVEIIEEDKKIYKLDWVEGNTFNKIQENSYLSRKEIELLDSNFKELGNKINEIIDKLNKDSDNNDQRSNN